MNITHSLIYIPDNAYHVKRSLASEIPEMSLPSNPLLRHVNKKNTPVRQNRMINLRAETQEQTPRPQRISGGNIYIKNVGGGPIGIAIPNGHDEQGNPLRRDMILFNIGERYQKKSAFSKQDIDSSEFQALYDAGKIIDIDEVTYREEATEETKRLEESGEIIRTRTKDQKIETSTLKAGDRQFAITEDLHKGEQSILVDQEIASEADAESESEADAEIAREQAFRESVAQTSRPGMETGDKPARKPGGRPTPKGTRAPISKSN